MAKSGRSCSYASCAIRGKKCGRRSLTPRICASGLPLTRNDSLATAGSTVKLTTAGAPEPRITETTVKRADAPNLLEYTWGDFDMRWQLEAVGDGTRLTLWTNIGRRFMAMGAAGWQICFDVLDRHLSGRPIGRIVGPEAMKFGWPRLHTEYAKQFGIEVVNWPAKPAQD